MKSVNKVSKKGRTTLSIPPFSIFSVYGLQQMFNNYDGFPVTFCEKPFVCECLGSKLPYRVRPCGSRIPKMVLCVSF